jgi:hypothetical protein
MAERITLEPHELAIKAAPYLEPHFTEGHWLIEIVGISLPEILRQVHPNIRDGIAKSPAATARKSGQPLLADLLEAGDFVAAGRVAEASNQQKRGRYDA